MFKPRLLITAALLLLLIILTGVLALGVIRKSRLDASSRELAIEITQDALTGSSSVLVDKASEEWLRTQNLPELTNYLAFVLDTLGPLRAMQSISGASVAPLFVFSAEIPSASYSIDLEFTNSPAHADINLRLHDSGWQITGFTIVTPLLEE